MAVLSVRSNYVLKPKGRLGRVLQTWVAIIKLLVMVLAAIALMHFAWGYYHEWRLAKDVFALRLRGEPMRMQSFAPKATVADDQNGALALRWAAESIDQWNPATEKIGWIYLTLPLSGEEMTVLGEALAGNREPMTRLRNARGMAQADWKIDYERSYWALGGDFYDEKELCQMALADILVMHQMERDKDAIERARDVLMMSRMIDQAQVRVCHAMAAGMLEAVSDKLQQISIDLRIGGSGGAVEPEDLRKLIAELLDESSWQQGERNAMRWQRAANVNALRGAAAGFWGSDRRTLESRYLGYAAKPWIMKDARLVLEHWNDLVSMSDSSTDWPSFNARLRAGTRAKGEIETHSKDCCLARNMIGDRIGEFVCQHWRASAERRMAAVMLAIRWYAVEHEGRLPENLAQLTPRYLGAVPKDPMAADGRAIGYVADANRPVIYSVGENGTDEGGSQKPPPKRWSSVNRWVWEDAVVHLRRQDKKFEPVRPPPEYYGRGVFEVDVVEH